MLDVGTKFPDFSLHNQDDEQRTLQSYAGNWLVLYVYPKDDTPGCTLQGKSFTARKKEFDELKIKVVGISQDDVESHKNFCNKYSFTIELLADPKATLLTKAHVGKVEHKGAQYWERSTFLIDPKGVLRKTYPKVNPEGHEEVLLKDIKELQKA